MKEIKKAWASWFEPTLGCDCPHCGEWNDYYHQWVDHDYPTDMLQPATRSELEELEFECPNCKKIFEFESIEW